MIETGISFGNIHSYNNLGLILSSCEISPAQPKTVYIDLPGGDGELDLSEALGEVRFKDRDCKFVFTVKPDATDTFETIKTAVSNALNGKSCRIVLDKDSGYYYQGRVSVNEYLQNKALKQITITAKVRPYKYKTSETEVTQNLSSSAKEVTLLNRRKTVCPTIIVSNSCNISFGGSVFSLTAGTHKVLGIRLTEGSNRLSVTGTGTVKFKYQEGEL